MRNDFPFSLSPSVFRIIAFFIFGVVVYFLYSSFFSSPSHSIFVVDDIVGCENLDRSSYGVSSSIFGDLPSPPKCFVSILSAFRNRSFVDLNFFDSSYYLQPEFYPNFLSEGLRVWKNPDDAHYGVVGYGSYPSHSDVRVVAPTKVYFFVFSGFGVRSVQSVSLRVVFENPSDANYFSVSLDEDTSQDFLLGPTFPKFHPLWVHPVILTVIPLDSSSSHSATISIQTVRSLADFSSDPITELFLFFDSTDYVGGRQVYRLTIRE
ncbi:MAG: hypothetical protein V1776_00230 [Candidatus Diapherotrites archaeon]